MNAFGLFSGARSRTQTRKGFRVVTLALLVSVACAAAGAADLNEPLVSPLSAKRRAESARQEKKQSAAPTEESALAAAVLAQGQDVFQILLAEVALRRGEPHLASSAYADLALRTRDPKVLERTAEVAGFARRFDVALDAARLWVDVEPESKQALYTLASVMVMSNQTEDLAPMLVRMLEADKATLPDNLLGLNRMLARNPDRRAVFGVIDKVAAAFAGVPEAHYAVAVAAAGIGQDERARAEARRALDLRPDWERAVLLQMQLLAKLSPEEARIVLQTFVDKYPKARDARMQLGRLLVGAKRYDDAQREFESVLKEQPDSPEAVYSVAILALQQNDLARAEVLLKRLLALPIADRSYANFFLGQIAEENKQNTEAIAYYAQVLGGEHFLQAQLRRARLLTAQGQWDEAAAQLRAARLAMPDARIPLAIAEAGVLRDAKQVQAAFDLLDALLTAQPDQTDLLYETALLAEKLGRLEVMETRLRKLIELRPESAQGYNALGYSLADRNLRLPEARALIEKALSLSPDDYFILDSMGWVLFRQGDLAGALEYLEKAHARRDDPEIAAHIGEVLWAQGRREEAVTVWQSAQQKFPDNESLADVIKKFQP